ncbi:MAG: tRNA pseudouridine(55) synthase TruB [Patescibacteria group bacterium]
MPFLLVDKPVGWTSFDVVGFIRKEERKNISAQGGQASGLKVGHAGTLDPFATGLLIVAVGRESTKRLDEFKKLPKTYIATVRLGATSDTDDCTGQISNVKFPMSNQAQNPNDKIPDQAQIKKTLQTFIGEQEQVPPRYSAKKINGQKMYSMARAGKDFVREPSVIHIYDIELLDYTWPDLKIKIDCGCGTYIRSLARDLGEALGVGGYCAELRRTRIGDNKIEDAIAISDLKIGR